MTGAPSAFEQLSRDLDHEARGLAAEPVMVMQRVQGRLRRAVEAGAFDPWRGREIVENGKTSLFGGRAGGGEWRVQLFQIAAGRSHPPHCHENLASCLVLIDGRLRVREYERLRQRETDEAATLRRVFDGDLRPGQALLTSENYRNAHWFGAVDGPVLAVNFKASGHFRRELIRLRNRRYLDASGERDGPFRARFITPVEAKSRFALQPL